MLFQNNEASLKLDVVNYEFPADAGASGSDDRNWLVLRCTWVDEEGEVHKDSNSCMLTYELQEMAAGLKVMHAGIRDYYVSEFQEPYFTVGAAKEEDHFLMDVSFYLPNTMDGDDTAELRAVMTPAELSELIDELDQLCKKYPDRT